MADESESSLLHDNAVQPPIDSTRQVGPYSLVTVNEAVHGAVVVPSPDAAEAVVRRGGDLMLDQRDGLSAFHGISRCQGVKICFWAHPEQSQRTGYKPLTCNGAFSLAV